MEIDVALHNLGALVTLGVGVVALLRPSVVAALVSLDPRGLIGVSELRSTYGGLFAALGAFAIVSQDMVAFTMLGAAWLGAALGRLASTVLDGSREARNYATIVFAGALALLLLFSH